MKTIPFILLLILSIPALGQYGLADFEDKPHTLKTFEGVQKRTSQKEEALGVNAKFPKRLIPEWTAYYGKDGKPIKTEVQNQFGGTSRVFNYSFEDGGLLKITVTTPKGRREFEYTYIDNREQSLKAFDKKERLLHEWNYTYLNDSLLVTAIKTDANGKELKKREYVRDSDLKVTEKKEFENGDLIEVTRFGYDDEGRETLWDITTYPQGKKNKATSQAYVTEYNADGLMGKRVIKTGDMIISSLDYTYEFNEQGQVIKKSETDQNGKLKEFTEYKYDEKGREIEEASFTKQLGGFAQNRVRRYFYNERDHLRAKTYWYSFDNTTTFEVFEYEYY